MYITNKVIFKDKSSTTSCKDYFFCTLCNFPNLSFEDFIRSREYGGICNECYLTFVEARIKEWKEGWRPNKETLEAHIYTRKCQLISEEKK